MDDKPVDDKQLGKILLKFSLITEAQLAKCLEILETLDPPVPLATLLVRRGLIDAKTLSSVSKMAASSHKGPEHRAEAEKVASQEEIAARLQGAGLAEYLRVARQQGGSDLYLTSGEPPVIRVHGKLLELAAQPLSLNECKKLLFSLMSKEQIATLDKQKHLDLSISAPEAGRFRANVFHFFGGLGGVFRVIPEEVWPFEELNLPPAVRDFVDFAQGLVLVTGPTGSGKSTTLASLIDIVNDRYNLHVISLEDPIEVIHESKRSLITQREIMTHTGSFATALRAALREDPDIIVVGEMRDQETVATALTAAETGHLVFGTLHTRDAYSTVLRIVDQFPAHKRSHVRTILAGVLRAVVCQQLLPTVTGDSRILASEVMVVNTAISNLIREDRPWQIPSVMQMSKGQGMQLMDDVLEQLVRDKVVPATEARARATDKARFAMLR